MGTVSCCGYSEGTMTGGAATRWLAAAGFRFGAAASGLGNTNDGGSGNVPDGQPITGDGASDMFKWARREANGVKGPGPSANGSGDDTRVRGVGATRDDTGAAAGWALLDPPPALCCCLLPLGFFVGATTGVTQGGGGTGRIGTAFTTNRLGATGLAAPPVLPFSLSLLPSVPSRLRSLSQLSELNDVEGVVEGWPPGRPGVVVEDTGVGAAAAASSVFLRGYFFLP
jgi:hypothetical protein